MLYFSQKVFAFLIVVICVFTSGAATGSESVEIGFVDVPALNMRSCPAKSCRILHVLEAGDRIRVLKEEGVWLRIVYDGTIGYISGDSEHVQRYLDPSASVDPEKTREKVREIASQISRFEQKEESLAGELQALDQQLSGSRRRLDEIRGSVAEIESRLEQIKDDHAEAQAAVDERKKYAGQRLASLYKLNRLGEMNLLATAGSLSDVFRRKAGIEAVVEHDEQVIGEMMMEKKRLLRLASELRDKKAERKRLEEDQRQALFELNQAAEVRKELLARLKARKSNRMAALNYLKDAARQMEETISGLKGEHDETSRVFSEYQGLLKMPVDGKVISKYGKYVEPQSGVVNFRNGIEIQSDHGAPVRAVSAGRAIFVDWLKGFGRVIILDHGKSYYTVYAHVEDLFCRKGDKVNAGEVIATVGDTGSLIGPALYFEVRHHGDPLDPLVWIENS